MGVGQLEDEAGLANARLADRGDDLAVAVLGEPEGPLERVELGLPPATG